MMIALNFMLQGGFIYYVVGIDFEEAECTDRAPYLQVKLGKTQGIDVMLSSSDVPFIIIRYVHKQNAYLQAQNAHKRS